MTIHVRVPNEYWHMSNESVTGIGFYYMAVACRAVFPTGGNSRNWIRISVPKLGPLSDGVWVEPGYKIKRLGFHSVNIYGKAIKFGVTDVQ